MAVMNSLNKRILSDSNGTVSNTGSFSNLSRTCTGIDIQNYRHTMTHLKHKHRKNGDFQQQLLRRANKRVLRSATESDAVKLHSNYCAMRFHSSFRVTFNALQQNHTGEFFIFFTSSHEDDSSRGGAACFSIVLKPFSRRRIFLASSFSLSFSRASAFSIN